MRPEKLYLLDIVEAGEAVLRFSTSISEEEFLQDELRQSAVLQKLIVIGEAASRLPVEFKNSHRDVIWEDIVGFRNIAVHEYFAILWEIVWNTAVRDIPDLIKRIRTIINDEYSDG